MGRDELLGLAFVGETPGVEQQAERGVGDVAIDVRIGDGDTLRVEFALRGREWKGRQGEIRYFNSLDVLKLERAEGAGGSAASAPDVDDADVPF